MVVVIPRILRKIYFVTFKDESRFEIFVILTKPGVSDMLVTFFGGHRM